MGKKNSTEVEARGQRGRTGRDKGRGSSRNRGSAFKAHLDRTGAANLKWSGVGDDRRPMSAIDVVVESSGGPHDGDNPPNIEDVERTGSSSASFALCSERLTPNSYLVRQ